MLKRENNQERFPLKIRIALALGIIILGFISFKTLVALKPKPPKGDVKSIAQSVEVIDVMKNSAQAVISGYGTIEATNAIDIKPLVSGPVTEVSPNFEKGGIIKKGEMLFVVDPRDYEIKVATEEANIATAKLELELEESNQLIAKSEWELIKDTIDIDNANQDLALRKPQIKQKQAKLNAAENNLNKAKLDLERTKITAPFNSIVISENIDIGSYVSPQIAVGSLAGIDNYEIEIKILQTELSLLPKIGTDVEIELEPYHKNKSFVTGKLSKILGDLDKDGKMAKVLIKINDPLNMNNKDKAEINKFQLGSFVKVNIKGKEIKDLFKIPNSSIREGSQIWLVSNQNKLTKKRIEIYFQDKNHSYVKLDDEIENNIIVITSSLRNPLEETALEIAAKK